jgi:hypothetical protein
MTRDEIIANRKKWVAALRSGEWKQCRGTMHDGEGYCCLGVAYMAFFPGAGIVPHRAVDATNNGFCYTPVADLAGLSNTEQSEFMRANDLLGKTFAEIADMIDALPDPIEVAP